MNTEGQAPSQEPDLSVVTARPMAKWLPVLPWVALGLLALVSLSLWLRLANIQQQLAQQSASAMTNSAEAVALAKNANELSRDATGKLSLLEAKLAEVSLQRTQLEELISSLSRSRDENLLEDIDSALRLAQQQASLTGSVEPLLAALKSAEQRINRAAQPRLNSVQRAIAKDIARLKAASAVDIPSILTKLDEAVRAVDDLPLANGTPARSAAHTASRSTQPSSAPRVSRSDESMSDRLAKQFQFGWQAIRVQTSDLVRLSRIDAPEAALVAPEQAYMLRENLKLKLLNARLGVLARQQDAARSDVRLAAEYVQKYTDSQSKRTQAMLANLQQVQTLLQANELPRPDDSLAALKLAGASR